MTVVTKQLCTQKKFNLPNTYLPTYLCDGSYCRDSSDSSYSIDSIDSSDSSDSSDKKYFFHQKNVFTRKLFSFSLKYLFHTKNHDTSSHKKSRNLFTQKKSCNLSTKKSRNLSAKKNLTTFRK